MRKIILASRSKARAKLLRQLGLKFSITSSYAKESTSLAKGAGHLVINNALEKAKHAGKKYKKESLMIVPVILDAGKSSARNAVDQKSLPEYPELDKNWLWGRGK